MRKFHPSPCLGVQTGRDAKTIKENRRQAYVLGRAVRILARWRTLYLQRRQLARLSDRLLKDIGLSPYDAAIESRKPFWRR